MKIQFNTDKTISGKENKETYFTSLIETGLKRFQSFITRIEVHLSDENGDKEGPGAIRCLMEARVKDVQPVVVSCDDDTIEKSVSGAIDKLKSSLDTIVGKLQNN